MMRELLGRKTNLIVEEIIDNMSIEENKIYTIPPDNDLVIEKNKFRLVKSSSTGPKPSINRLFKSLAKSYKSKAIGKIFIRNG